MPVTLSAESWSFQQQLISHKSCDRTGVLRVHVSGPWKHCRSRVEVRLGQECSNLLSRTCQSCSPSAAAVVVTIKRFVVAKFGRYMRQRFPQVSQTGSTVPTSGLTHQ